MRIAVENHITVPFTEDMDQGGHEEERWTEGVDTLAQIKRFSTDLDTPCIGVCVAPAHLWVMNETISEVITYLAERKKLFHYYVWDISRSYRRGVDGLNFGPGEEQLPRPDGTLDHRVLLQTLANVGYEGVASLKCHGTAGWPLEKVTAELGAAADVHPRAPARGRAVTEPLRWGAVGASWIAEDWVIPAIRQTGAEVVAVSSHDAERATAYAAKNGIPKAYASLDGLLADPNVDAVYISSTNQWHHPQTVAAARAGKHVLCEKPMATTLEEARAMIAACESAGVVLAIDHHMRNAPTLRTIKRLLDEGAIGRPLAVRIAHAMLLPDFLRTWRTSAPDAGGGPILDLTTHDTDNLRFILGDEVDEVVAMTAGQRFSANGVEDAVMAVLRFRGGVDRLDARRVHAGWLADGARGPRHGRLAHRHGSAAAVARRRGRPPAR